MESVTSLNKQPSCIYYSDRMVLRGGGVGIKFLTLSRQHVVYIPFRGSGLNNSSSKKHQPRKAIESLNSIAAPIMAPVCVRYCGNYPLSLTQTKPTLCKWKFISLIFSTAPLTFKHFKLSSYIANISPQELLSIKWKLWSGEKLKIMHIVLSCVVLRERISLRTRCGIKVAIKKRTPRGGMWRSVHIGWKLCTECMVASWQEYSPHLDKNFADGIQKPSKIPAEKFPRFTVCNTTN